MRVRVTDERADVPDGVWMFNERQTPREQFRMLNEGYLKYGRINFAIKTKMPSIMSYL